jgi:hypothetical protein
LLAAVSTIDFLNVKMKKTLELNKVVLIGRIYEEYAQYFELNRLQLEGQKILDIGAGVSAFCAQAHEKNYSVLAADPIYALSPALLEKRCQTDLIDILSKLSKVMYNYQWEFYKNLDGLKAYREKAYQTFLQDFVSHRTRYIATSLPKLPFKNNAFTLSLVSYFLFLYEQMFDYNFHRDSILELSRVTSGEIRIYPLMSYELTRSRYLEKLFNDESCHHLHFEIKKVDFEFLNKANEMLIIRKNL